jgi:hypothetical protein
MNAPSPPSPAFHFINIVWGESYTKLFAKVVLPTQVSAGNLGAFSRRDQADRYFFYSTAESERIIREAKAFAVMAEQIEVRFISIDEELAQPGPKHEVLTRAHQRSIRQALEDEAALVFLCPDAIWSDGSFGRLPMLAEAGRRAVVMPGIRLREESFLPAYAETFRPDADGVIEASARDLTRLGLKHLHQITQTCCWDAELLNPHMSHLYFPVRERDRLVGLAARCFHLHPLMVWPTNPAMQFNSTIDGDFLPLACPDPEAIHIVTDSDEMVVYELSDDAMNIAPQWSKSDRPAATADWVRQFADSYHRRYAHRPMRIHTGEGDAKTWHRVEHRAARIMRRIDLLRISRRFPMGRTLTRQTARVNQFFKGRKVLATEAAGLRTHRPERPPLRWRPHLPHLPPLHSRHLSQLHYRTQHFQRQFRSRLWVRSSQWWPRLRRRWWLVSNPVRFRWQRIQRRANNVGWLRIFAIRTRLRKLLGMPRPGDA